MDKTSKKDWNPHFNIDNAANLAVLATGLFIAILAAATAETEAVPQALQFVYQDPAGRIVVTAIRPKALTPTPGVRPAEHGSPVQLAASSPTGPLHFNQHDLDGDNHAK